MSVVLQYINIANLDTRKKLALLAICTIMTVSLLDSLGNVIWLVLLIIVWMAVVETEQIDTDDFLKKTEERLENIDPKHQYPFLYYDVAIIELLSSVIELKTFSETSWDLTLASLSNFFNLYDDIVSRYEYLQTKVGTYHGMIEEYKNICAHFHTFVYSVPRHEIVFLEKYNEAFHRLRVLVVQYIKAARFELENDKEIQDILREIEDTTSGHDFMNTVDNIFYVS